VTNQFYEYSIKPIAELAPYAKNSRTHSKKQVNQIAASIKEFGFTNPILVDDKGGIIAGHGRILAAKQAGMETVPTITITGLTAAQKRALVISDNKLALNAGWDTVLLSEEIGDLKDDGYDISILGFEDDELADLLEDDQKTGLVDDDEVPEVQPEAITKLGDIWILGSHRLMCGDSTSVDAVEKLMDGQKADLVFTDPPYGMFLDADYSGMNSMFKGSSGGNKYENVIGDHADFSPELVNTVFANFDYCKEIFMWGADYYAEHIPSKNAGSWVVWDKRGDESADKMYGSTFELCWSKARHKRMMARVKWAGIFGMEKEHDKKRCHPTQKPVELACWFFDYFSMADKKIVVDLFGGSGSTMIACEKTDRHARLMELDPKYCDVIIRRWQQFTGQKAILEISGRTFEEVSKK